MDMGLYCFQVMPFDMKNTGAMHQWLVNRMLKTQIIRNMKVYVDNLLVKIKETDHHIVDLRETLAVLRKYNMKLNPAKYAFVLRSCKFVGFVVTDWGIKVNLEKIKAIMKTKPRWNLNEVKN